MFKPDFTESALQDLGYLNKTAQVLVVSAIEQQLVAEPTKQTRNRKPLRPNDLSKWELRVSTYRVFYDVDEAAKTVTVKAVGWKEHNALYIRGKEFKL